MILLFFPKVAMYDYQAAADDEISFDPDDLITHIEQVNFIKLVVLCFVLNKYKNIIFNLRLTRVGGVDYAKINTDYFQRIMFNFSNKQQQQILFFFFIFVFLFLYNL